MTALILALQLVSGSGVLLYSVDADVDTRRQSLLRGSLRLELEKLDGVNIVDFQQAIAQQPLVQDCDVKPPAGRECLARFAEAFASDEVVTARANIVGGLSVLLLKRLRLSDGEIVASVTRNLSRGEGEEFLLALGDAVAELYPEKVVKAGEARGVSLAVAERWTPEPIPTWAFWAGVAVSAGLAGGTIYSAVQAKNAEDAYNDLAQAAKSEPVSGAKLVALQRDAQEHANVTTGLLIGGLASAAVTTLLGVFADWEDDPTWVAER